MTSSRESYYVRVHIRYHDMIILRMRTSASGSLTRDTSCEPPLFAILMPSKCHQPLQIYHKTSIKTKVLSPWLSHDNDKHHGKYGVSFVKSSPSATPSSSNVSNHRNVALNEKIVLTTRI